METYSGKQIIRQLEKRKGGYFYLKIDAEVVNQFAKKKTTRLICSIDDSISYRCGLNHLGDGNFYIIVATKYLDQISKQLGDVVSFKIDIDPDQLGVEVPEVLSVFLEQEPQSKKLFDQLTDGKKRSLIYSIRRLKSLDIQVRTISDFLAKQKVIS